MVVVGPSSSLVLILVCWKIFFEVSGVLLVQFLSSCCCSSSRFEVVFLEVMNGFFVIMRLLHDSIVLCNCFLVFLS